LSKPNKKNKTKNKQETSNQGKPEATDKEKVPQHKEEITCQRSVRCVCLLIPTPPADVLFPWKT
jgi:hypothetical protein